MGEIYLNDIINFSENEINNSKISLNISEGKNGRLCLDSWLETKSTRPGFWCYYGKQKNFKIGQYCLAFYKIDWGGNKYLLVGAGKITNIPAKEEWKPASYEPIERLQKFVGRLIIDVYKGNTQGRYNFNLKKYIYQAKVVEILPSEFEIRKFPGFNNLRLNYTELYKAIYVYRTWEEVLKTRKAIYIIVDKSKDEDYSGLGRIYVGKASSENGMLYARWKNYVDSLTGGNKELEKVKRIKGEEYIKNNFQWSVIESFDESYDDNIISEREKYWKLVLNSKNQGLNDNY